MGQMIAAVLLIATCTQGSIDADTFRSVKYGVKAEIPKNWRVEIREREDMAFVALIPQGDPDRPGVAACELGLAPERLEEYRSRIEANAQRGRNPGGGELVRNELVKVNGMERLESVWEFRLAGGEVWRERKTRMIANRQMYTFTLNVDQASLAKAEPAFDAMVNSVSFAPPDSGAERMKPAPNQDKKESPKSENRWKQREFLFSIDLPDEWAPALAPSELALFYANGKPQGIWADNVLVLARQTQGADYDELAKQLPEQVRREDPACEVLSCRVIQQGKVQALETVVRTQRGPFSMTVLERRFSGERFDYEVKFTLESKRFEKMAPLLRRSLDSFREEPGVVTAVPLGKPA